MTELPPPLPPGVPRKKGVSAVVWIVIGLLIVLLLALLFAGVGMIVSRAKVASAMEEAASLENSINQFYYEYGALPEPGSSKRLHDIKFDTSGPEGQALLSILMAKESASPPQNSKGIRFFIGREGKGGKHGLIPLPSGSSELRDPWGNPYQVLIDGDYDEALTPPADSGSPAPVKGRRALVYSLGRDGKGGAEAVRTW